MTNIFSEKTMVFCLEILITLGVVVFVDRVVRQIIERNSNRAFFHTVSPRLAKGLARGFIFGIGLLIFLDSVGVSITPVLASLGIGSLAVGLALQDTLSNFFSGLYVAIDKPVQAGDFIKLESGDEGVVSEVGWRSTRVHTLAGNMVIIPNSKLMGSVITNFNLPAKDLALTVEVGVHYDSDLSKVERVALDVAHDVLRSSPAAVTNFEPMIRFHTFADSSINLTVVLRAKNFPDAATLKHEFIKKLHERFKKEAIIIPYPIRTLEFVNEPTLRR